MSAETFIQRGAGKELQIPLLRFSPILAGLAKIGVVDDDISVQHALGRLLRSAGYETATFSSAQELLDSGFAEVASCLVIDLHIGAISGWDLLERLKNGPTPPPPTIFITGHVEEASHDRAVCAGAVTCLRKPFEASALLDAVMAALATREK